MGDRREASRVVLLGLLDALQRRSDLFLQVGDLLAGYVQLLLLLLDLLVLLLEVLLHLGVSLLGCLEGLEVLVALLQHGVVLLELLLLQLLLLFVLLDLCPPATLLRARLEKVDTTTVLSWRSVSSLTVSCSRLGLSQR